MNHKEMLDEARTALTAILNGFLFMRERGPSKSAISLTIGDILSLQTKDWRIAVVKREEDSELKKDVGTIIAEYSANEDDYSLVGVVREILARCKGEYEGA